MRQLSTPIKALLVPLAIALLTPLAASGQVAKVAPLTFDFGDMQQNETVRTALTVTNEGARRLEIISVDADCGCTVPTLLTTSLGPGESTDIQIEFNSKRFHDTVYKGVHVKTNDPINPVIDVMLTANVFAPLVIDPASQRIGFTRSLQGETKTRRVVFTASGDTPLEISANRTRKGLFRVKAVNEVDGNPQIAALEVTLPANLEPGRQRDNVRVTTNVEAMPTVDIEIQGWVVKDLIANPDRVSFRFQKSLNQSIRVAPFQKGTTFRITKAECDLPEISVKVVETRPNEETQVLLSGSPVGKDDPRAVANRGRINGTVKIYANDEDQPTLVIPVSYMIRM